MGNFLALFDRLEPDPRVRGQQFEHVCKWFLSNDPTYKATLRRVWLWDEWPGRWGGDAGIDLVAEDYAGQVWAIQCKAYAPNNAVTKSDVDKFLSESSRAVFSYRLLIATTDKLNHVARRTIDQQEKQVSFLGLSDIVTSVVNWRANPLDVRPSTPLKPAKPREHQREAIREVAKGFAKADRGQLIMACGTGKTLTSLFIKEKLAADRTLVLVPSLSLLKQTMQEWTVNRRVPFESLPVCSDETVGRSEEDAAVGHASELGVPVTTAPENIATFLRRRSGPRVVFATYQSSPQIAAGYSLGRVPAFDLVIADEAHRVTGIESSAFGTVLDESAIKARRRLFMTATPRYFTGRVLKAAQEADLEVASMDDASKFGTVFHRLSFGQAIQRNLLTDYQVAVIGVDNDTYREWAEKGTLLTRDGNNITDARTLAGQIGLAKAMRKYDLRRCISFHSRVARAREFAAKMPEVIAWMPPRQRPKGALWARHASGEMSAGQRHVLLQHLSRLDDDERGLLTNARCLSEGVDVPTLDGVAFIDPRRSEVDIVQAVGRAIRKSKSKIAGTIVIPVFIDAATDPDVALNDSSFKPVWDVIKALRAHDEDLGDQIDSLRRQIGRDGAIPTLPDKIRLDLPARVEAEFADAFNVRLVERATESWEFWFGLLERFVAENGTAQVNKDYVFDGHRLGGWCVNQRARCRQGQLAADKVARLDGLHGWVWDRHESRWEAGFETMQRYVEMFGHARPVATETFDGYPIGTWVYNQRSFYHRGAMEQARIEKLMAVPGWSWIGMEDHWGSAVARLEEYVARHGTALVPQLHTSEDGFRLGAWVNVQRSRYRDGKLTDEQGEQLMRFPGWTWGASESKWENAFRRLADYADTHGTARVPHRHVVDGIKLGDWVVNQRAKWDNLSEERRRKLESLPGWFENTYDAQWGQGFQRLLEYVNEHGTAAVPRAHVVGGHRLGSWVDSRRNEYKRGKLSADRVLRLGDLPGWEWDPHAAKWTNAFHHLLEYVDRSGGDFPTQKYIDGDGFRLGAWLFMQRHLKGKGQLDSDRSARLDEIPGWASSPRTEFWEEGYRRLADYLERNSYTVPVAKYVEPDGYRLGAWASQQRSLGNRGKLSTDRRAQLDMLKGWTWNPRRGAAARSR